MYQEKSRQKQVLQSKCKKNSYRFNLGGVNQRQITISSNFDSGNIELVKQISETNYRLAAVSDYQSQYRNKKTWFYFKMKGPKYLKVKLMIENVDILIPAYQYQIRNQKPVVKVGEDGEWKRLEQNCFLSYREELEIYIDYTFQSEQQVYLALTVPFSYHENNKFLSEVSEQIPNEIYFNKEILIYSKNHLLVHLLTITQNEDTEDMSYEERFNFKMFPDQNRPYRFNKPVVFITCRVHPGEVTSSHTLVGIIRFLLNTQDLRAYLLRKLFLFNIVPMVNPDGVYEGNYRMDPHNINLNRMYINPNEQELPSVYAIKQLVEHLNSQQRVQFYFDMHGHSSSKCAFVYGNAFDNLVFQVQSQVFCKVLSLNSKFFSYESCNFSEKHMVAKDKNEPFSKEGCSRVVFGKLTGLIHCLTVQTGLHDNQKTNTLPQLTNCEFSYLGKGCIKRNENDTLTYLQCFYDIGESLLISILDVTQKNPFSRIKNSQMQSLDNIRKTLATSILQEEERFKLLDLKAYQKSKFITKFIKDAFTDKINQKWTQCAVDKDLLEVDWPIEGLNLFKEMRESEDTKRTNKKRRMNHIETVFPETKNDTFLMQSLHKVSIKTDETELMLRNKSQSPKEKPTAKSTQNVLPKMVYKMTLRLENPALELIKNTNFSKNKSTRKLLRDFKNEKTKYDNLMRNSLVAEELHQKQRTEGMEESQLKVNLMKAITEQICVLNDSENRKNFNLRFQNRNSNKRIKTEISDNNNPLVVSVNKVIIKTQNQLIQTILEKETEHSNRFERIDKLEDERSNSKNKRRQISTKYGQLRKVEHNVKLPEIMKQRKAEQEVQQQRITLGQRTKELQVHSIKLNTTFMNFSHRI